MSQLSGFLSYKIKAKRTKPLVRSPLPSYQFCITSVLIITYLFSTLSLDPAQTHGNLGASLWKIFLPCALALGKFEIFKLNNEA